MKRTRNAPDRDAPKRRKWTRTPLQVRRHNAVVDVIEDLRDFWPLTVRQIHYQLVERQPIWYKSSLKNPEPYRNTVKNYQDLSTVLKWARIDEKVPWDVLTDRTRRVSDKRGYTDLSEFISEQIGWFLTAEIYDRCLVQSQDIYLEIWIEKDALSTVIEEVADPFCLRVVTRRGYNSITAEADYFQRATKAIEQEQKPVVLYFGDFDPSGRDMLGASLRTLKDEMGLSQLETVTVALTREQINQYGLPEKPEAAKKSDPRYKRYVKKHGTSAWELDALHPRELQKIAESAIRQVLDMENFEIEKENQEKDKSRLNRIRAAIIPEIKRIMDEF